jgi:excinuclease UvrABC nuclease subunit
VRLGSVDRRTQNALVEHYGSVRALRAAPVSDIASVAGVSSDVAAAIQKDVD